MVKIESQPFECCFVADAASSSSSGVRDGMTFTVLSAVIQWMRVDWILLETIDE